MGDLLGNNVKNIANSPSLYGGTSPNDAKSVKNASSNPSKSAPVQGKTPSDYAWKHLSNVPPVLNNPTKILSAQIKHEIQGNDSIKDIKLDPSDPSQFILNAFDDKRFEPIMDKVIEWAANYLCLKDSTQENRTKVLDKLVKTYKVGNQALNDCILGKIDNILADHGTLRSLKKSIYEKFITFENIYSSSLYYKFLSLSMINDLSMDDRPSNFDMLIKSFMASSDIEDFADTLKYLSENLKDPELLARLANSLIDKISYSPQSSDLFNGLEIICGNKNTRSETKKKIVSYYSKCMKDERQYVVYAIAPKSFAKILKTMESAITKPAIMDIANYCKTIGSNRPLAGDPPYKETQTLGFLFAAAEEGLIGHIEEECICNHAISLLKISNFYKIEFDGGGSSNNTAASDFISTLTKYAGKHPQYKDSLYSAISNSILGLIDLKDISDYECENDISNVIHRLPEQYQKLIFFAAAHKHPILAFKLLDLVQEPDISLAKRVLYDSARIFTEETFSDYCTWYEKQNGGITINATKRKYIFQTYLKPVGNMKGYYSFEHNCIEKAYSDHDSATISFFCTTTVPHFDTEDIESIMSSSKISPDPNMSFIILRLIRNLNAYHHCPKKMEEFIIKHRKFFRDNEGSMLNSGDPDLTLKYFLALHVIPERCKQYLEDLLLSRQYKPVVNNIDMVNEFDRDFTRKVFKSILRDVAVGRSVFELAGDNFFEQVEEVCNNNKFFARDLISILDNSKYYQFNNALLELNRIAKNASSPNSGNNYMFSKLNDIALAYFKINGRNITEAVKSYLNISKLGNRKYGKSDSYSLYLFFARFIGSSIVRYLNDDRVARKKWDLIFGKDTARELEEKLIEHELYQAEQPSNISKFAQHVLKGDFSYAFDRAWQKVNPFRSGSPDNEITGVGTKPYSAYSLSQGFSALEITKNNKKIGLLFTGKNGVGKADVLIMPGKSIEKSVAEMNYPGIVMQTTGTYTSADNMPTDLVIKNGKILSYYISSRTGIIIIDQSGNIHAANLKNLKVSDLLPGQTNDHTQLDIFGNIKDFNKFTEIAKTNNLSILQGHLIYYDGQSQISSNASSDATERRVFVTFDNGTYGILVFDGILSFKKLSAYAKALSVKSMMNLDTGTYNFLSVYDANHISHVFGEGLANSTTKLVFYK